MHVALVSRFPLVINIQGKGSEDVGSIEKMEKRIEELRREEEVLLSESVRELGRYLSAYLPKRIYKKSLKKN